MGKWSVGGWVSGKWSVGRFFLIKPDLFREILKDTLKVFDFKKQATKVYKVMIFDM